MLLLRKQFASLLRAASHPTTVPLPLSPPLHRVALLLSTSTSTTTSAPTPFPIEEYLVDTWGLTRAQALKASKKLAHFKGFSNPDAVLALFSGAGLSRPDIAAAVAADPLLLRARVGNIADRLDSLRDRVGLSDPEIARFLMAGGARVIRYCDVAPKLEFWIPFFGSLDKLLKIMRRNNRILTADLEKIAKPNIELFQQSGLSVCDIAKMLNASSRLLCFNPERVKVFIKRVEKLGVSHASYTFKYAIGVVCSVGEGKLASRMEFLKNTLGCSMEKARAAVSMYPSVLGLSEEKILSKIELLRSGLGCSNDKLSVVLCKRPGILGLSEYKLRRKIEFMVYEVGLEREYILERPLVLSYSLEKRMAPRHYVIKILQAKGLLKEDVGFRQLVDFSEKRFATRIGHHMNAVPGLTDAYAADCAGQIPAKLHLLMDTFVGNPIYEANS